MFYSLCIRIVVNQWLIMVEDTIDYWPSVVHHYLISIEVIYESVLVAIVVAIQSQNKEETMIEKLEICKEYYERVKASAKIQRR